MEKLNFFLDLLQSYRVSRFYFSIFFMHTFNMIPPQGGPQAFCFDVFNAKAMLRVGTKLLSFLFSDGETIKSINSSLANKP